MSKDNTKEVQEENRELTELDGDTKITALKIREPQHGIRFVRLIDKGRCVAKIWDNVPFRDPYFSPLHDYAGQMSDDSRVYFPTWEKAMEWIKGIEEEINQNGREIGQ
jgi:hypothetical protein